MKNLSCDKKVFLFDLDDTLINTKLRHYTIISDFLIKHEIEPYDFEHYISLRNKGMSNKSVVCAKNKLLGNAFDVFWKNAIEDGKYLELDECIVNIELLEKAKKKFSANFIVLSLRSNYKSARLQFESLPFAKLFNQVIFLPHDCVVNPKKKWIKGFIENHSVLFFVGDSWSDYEAAIFNGVKFYWVSTGWHSKYGGSIAFDNINTFLQNLIMNSL